MKTQNELIGRILAITVEIEAELKQESYSRIGLLLIEREETIQQLFVLFDQEKQPEDATMAMLRQVLDKDQTNRHVIQHALTEIKRTLAQVEKVREYTVS